VSARAPQAGSSERPDVGGRGDDNPPPSGRIPSGLFPGAPPRPQYREALGATEAWVAAGVGAGALWMLLFGLLATTRRGYAWSTLVAALLAWGSALVLGRFGNRGAAAGVAISSGVGLSIAFVVVYLRLLTGHWLLW
jgi:hypothetical protein